jgi:protein TonB
MNQWISRSLSIAIAASTLAAAPAGAADAPSAAASAVVSARIVPPKGGSCDPQYPITAAEHGAEGASHLRFYVDAAGKPTAVGIVQSAGPTPDHHLLDIAAAKALAECDFIPARDASGKPVASELDFTYTWKLK